MEEVVTGLSRISKGKEGQGWHSKEKELYVQRPESPWPI